MNLFPSSSAKHTHTQIKFRKARTRGRFSAFNNMKAPMKLHNRDKQSPYSTPHHNLIQEMEIRSSLHLLFLEIRSHRVAVGATYQSILVAVPTTPHHPSFLIEHLTAPATNPARHEPHTATAGADEARVLPPHAFKKLHELPGLVELPHLLRPTNTPPLHKHLRQREGLVPPNQGLELMPEGGVHGHIPLVDGDTEAFQDGANGAAVLVGAADAAQRGRVEDDARALGGFLRDGFPEGFGRVAMMESEGSGEMEGFLGVRGGGGRQGLVETVHEVPSVDDGGGGGGAAGSQTGSAAMVHE